jgi:two-component system CheB/CheR fusion protein
MRDVRWARPNGEDVVLDVAARPLTETDGTFLGTGVTFVDVSDAHRRAAELEDVRRLLQASYQDVQSAMEELETTNEELQSTVEELETTNEELQSTNEELETTNEELRAVNEELYARGVEEHALTAQAEDLNRILDTVMEGMGAGVIVVDADLRVLVWTRTSQELWGLRADEVLGQPLESLDMGMDPARLARHARSLLPMPDRRTGPSGAGKEHVGTQGQSVSELIEAVNRRGRSIRVRLTALPVVLHDGMARVVRTVEGGASGSRGPQREPSSAHDPVQPELGREAGSTADAEGEA